MQENINEIEDLLLAILEYLREYHTYAHIAPSYDIAESDIYREIRWVEETVHDFQLFKNTKTHLKSGTQLTADIGYQGLIKLHANTILPKKSSKNHPLSKQERKPKEVSQENVSLLSM